jgi:hypothetical protein
MEKVAKAMEGSKTIARIMINFFMSRLPEPNWFDRLEAGSKIQIRSRDTAYKRDFSAGISAQDLFFRPLL